MKRVRVKVCGLREPEKAAAIARSGADAIGLVFADSPRWVSPEDAIAVARAVPALVSLVGVFVDNSTDAINAIARRVGLTYVQVHDDRPAESIDDIERPVIKAFRVRDKNWLSDIQNWLANLKNPEKVQAILLDAYVSGVAGGTGEAFNWELVADARKIGLLNDLPPIILAGGLNEENIDKAIFAAEPWAVDVSSGVEISPGIKDVAKADRFIKKVTDDCPKPTGKFWDLGYGAV